MNNNIVIIGAGQLGSRHLQALKKVKNNLNITVVDNNESSLKISKERYEQIQSGMSDHKVEYTTEISSLNEDIAVAIIATGSGSRRNVIETLYDKCDVKYMVLEKWLFRYTEDFSIVQQLIDKHDTKAWVNCTMRMMPYYKEVKDKLKDAPMLYSVVGGDYGFITNLIHYVDYLMFLNNTPKFHVITDGLIPKIIRSKRDGYYEMHGSLSIICENGSVGQFTEFENSNLPPTSSITNSKMRLDIDEINGVSQMRSIANGFSKESSSFRIPFQSELTTVLVEELLNDGTCDLPTFKESSYTHITLMESILSFIKKYNLYDEKGFIFT